MALFMVLAALMVAVALAFVIVPLQRHARGAAASDASARRQRALDEALAAGVIDADEFAKKRATLASQPGAAITRPSRIAFATLLLVAILLPASALLLYRLVGTPQALDPANLKAEAAPAKGDRGLEMEQAIAILVARLKSHPDDVEGWSLLGRAYQAKNQADESLAAFKRAHEQAPDNATVAVEYAQALAFATPDHRIQGEARTLLENTLKTDAGNQRALWLLGISDYQGEHYAAAIAYWNTLLPLLASNSDVATSVKKQIADAQARRDGNAPPPSVPASPSQTGIAPEAAPAGATDASAQNAPRLTVNVALDPKLKAKLDPDATLFVFVRAAKGPPMPLAIQRLKASQLPLTLTLDDSMGMLPTMKLSMFPQIVVGARVSKSGNAMPQSGDLQTFSTPTDVHRVEPIELTIDQAVP